MEFRPTQDADLVREILTHPKLYRRMSDDGCPAPEEFYPEISENLSYILAIDQGRILGLFLFHPHNAVTFEVHTALLPHAWGPAAVEAARGVVRWFFHNTNCQRIITSVPRSNRLALKLARRAGFKQWGTNSRSFLKNGQLEDLLMLGISRRK